jgi:drug/metabolite transporter superfamily protein YnfA
MGWALLKTALLFIATALAEILGCFLPYLWLRRNGPIWLLLPAAASLALFVWLLTLHPAASGRVYAAYGGVYVATALIWAAPGRWFKTVGVRRHWCGRRAHRDGDHRPRVAWRCLAIP